MRTRRPHRKSMTLNTRQDGVVLMVVLMLLLLTTIVGYQVMETSSLEARMSVAREGQEISFQGAESAIDQTKNDTAVLADSFNASISGTAWPTRDITFTGDAALDGGVEVRYIDEIAALGNNLVLGSTGLRSLHFEIRATTGRDDSSSARDRFVALHTQGMKRFAPKLN
ncbi:MAG: PilX N-terminal domain-containing pilus assembly protein [Pseudomonadota bacterium]